MSLAFLAHPVGTDPIQADRNLINARWWMERLIHDTNLTIVASWIPYCEVLHLEADRARGIRDNFAVIERCDFIVLTGGRVSPGMEQELGHAKLMGVGIIDLTSFGWPPPVPNGSEWASVLNAIAIAQKYQAPTRGKWLPTLARNEFEALARVQDHLFRIGDGEAIGVLAKILGSSIRQERTITEDEIDPIMGAGHA